MALADPFVNIPSGTRPATFETDSENYHNVQLPQKISEIAAAALAMSLNSVIGTSTTSMLIGTGAKTLTVQINKSFLAGMDIRVVDVANPTVNYVNAVVTSYVVGTGVLNFTVPSGQAFGAGTLSNWSVFQIPAGGATNTFVQQLVQTQSATAFTTAGTSSAFTLTPNPAISANLANQMFFVRLNVAPAGSPTLAVSGQTPLSFKYYNSAGVKQFITAAVAPINWQSFVFNDGTDWVMIDVLPLANNAITQGDTSVDVSDSGTGFINVTIDGALRTLHSAAARSATIDGGTTLYPFFHCRAWVNFNGTGTVAIRASGNLSSITDDGVGDYTFNFTTAMPDVNYAVTGSARNAGTQAIVLPFMTGAALAADPLVGSFKFQTRNTAAGVIDCAYVNLMVMR